LTGIDPGFTLVELTVVVAIAAILASVAYPSYVDHIRRTHRAAAQAALSEVAALQEQFFLDNKRYATNIATELSAQVQVDDGAYALSVAGATSSCPINRCYLLQAAPQGDQARDSCGTLGLGSGGTRTPTGCWSG
jgi:type IV pilus assembly protein PilE